MKYDKAITTKYNVSSSSSSSFIYMSKNPLQVARFRI
jgi:hypothetical protein